MTRNLTHRRRNRRLQPAPLIDLSWLPRVPFGAAACRAISRWFPLAPGITDLVMPLEDAFGIRIPPQDVEQLAGRLAQITAGELHLWICERLRAMNKDVPYSSWHRAQKVLAESGGIALKQIHRDSSLHSDLRLFEGG